MELPGQGCGQTICSTAGQQAQQGASGGTALTSRPSRAAPILAIVSEPAWVRSAAQVRACTP